MSVKQYMTVLALANDGPVHCHDVADETGLSMYQSSAILSWLHSAGMLCRRVKVRPANARHDCWLYELPRKSA